MFFFCSIYSSIFTIALTIPAIRVALKQNKEIDDIESEFSAKLKDDAAKETKKRI